MGASSTNWAVIGGGILVLLGLFGFAVPIFSTQQTKDVIAIGDVKIQSTQSTEHSIPPLLSGSSLVLGIVLIGAGLYRKR
jgi:hypothetical protein